MDYFDYMLDFIKELQTLIVVGLGFIGVIMTLRINAKNSTEQLNDSRRHEARALRIALIEELKNSSLAIERNLRDTNRHLAELDGAHAISNFQFPIETYEDVFAVFTSRIGLLSQTEVQKVMAAYLRIRSFAARFRYAEFGSFDDRNFIKVSGKNLEMVVDAMEALNKPINDAVAAMEDALS